MNLLPIPFCGPVSHHVFAEAQPSEDKIPEVYNINHNTSDIAGLCAFVQDKQHAGRMAMAASSHTIASAPCISQTYETPVYVANACL